MERLTAAVLLSLALVGSACSTLGGGGSDEAETGWSIEPALASSAESVWVVELAGHHRGAATATGAERGG